MGVTRSVIKAGNGPRPQKGNTVVIHYVGKLAEGGMEFDSSRNKSVPVSFQLGAGAVIKGWDEGVAQMSLREISTLEVTPDYGYGERGSRGIIPPNATLIFEVELLEIK